jgi:hypothetical protein
MCSLRNRAKMQVKIDKRFNGPASSGHGGYACGILAQYIKGTAEVTLLKPIPLEKDLTINKNPDDRISLLEGDAIIATAHKADFQLSPPPTPSYSDAVEASKKYIGFDEEYPYPDCFGCGRNRKSGDGLRIFPGRLSGNNIVTAPWIPDEELQDRSERIKDGFLWAALDCPGGIACVGDHIHPLLLGKFAVEIKERPRANQRCIVTGWPIAKEGRKHSAGTALYSEEGKLLAYGKATWIQPR